MIRPQEEMKFHKITGRDLGTDHFIRLSIPGSERPQPSRSEPNKKGGQWPMPSCKTIVSSDKNPGKHLAQSVGRVNFFCQISSKHRNLKHR